MPRVHAVVAGLLVAVFAVGIGTVQARAGGESARPAEGVVRSDPVSAPVRESASTKATPYPTRAVGAQPRPVVSFPNRLRAGWGIDISWPQCEQQLPAVQAGFAIVGVNGGRPFTGNACFAEQVNAARGQLPLSAYLNLGAPAAGDPRAYARRAVDDGLTRLKSVGLHVPVVWLDVEIANAWRDPATNVAVIAAALERLHERGVSGGVYSSVPMWQQITGGATLHAPVWLAITGSEVPSLRHACAVGMGGMTATMVQYVASAPDGGLVDADVLCRTDASVLRLFAN